MAGLNGFSRYKEITISHANVDSDLSSFPAYVPIVNDADIGGRCRADGYDVQFANSDNSDVLYFERLPGFAVAGGQANGDFYVRIPTVAGTSDTVIRCYYGKAGAADASSPENTFQAADGWIAVWHLEEGSNPYVDATSNNHDSTLGTYPTQVNGKVVKAQDFEAGSSQYISFPDANDLSFVGNASGSMWIKPESLPGTAMYLLAKIWGTSTEWNCAFNSSNQIYFIVRNTGASDFLVVVATTAPSAGTWYHVAWVFNNDTDVLRIYLNGLEEAIDNTPSGIQASPSTGALCMGAKNTTYFFDGIIDEARMLSVVLSAAWIKFEFYNSHDGHAAGNEMTWGAEQSTSEAAVMNAIFFGCDF